MSEELKKAVAFAENLSAHFVAQGDLFTTCQTCKKMMKGTLTELELHVLLCGGSDGKGN